MNAVSRRELLVWQFDMTWSLFEVHLPVLDTADFWWEPAGQHWTMHRREGVWEPDFATVEPDPIPVCTVAWLTWHIGWWWSTAMDHLAGRPPREMADIDWPGPEGAVEWLRELRTRWHALLNELDESDLDAPAEFPWGAEAELTMAHLIGWVNAELMKNASEIGQLRVMRAAR